MRKKPQDELTELFGELKKKKKLALYVKKVALLGSLRIFIFFSFFLNFLKILFYF